MTLYDLYDDRKRLEEARKGLKQIRTAARVMGDRETMGNDFIDLIERVMRDTNPSTGSQDGEQEKGDKDDRIEGTGVGSGPVGNFGPGTGTGR